MVYIYIYTINKQWRQCNAPPNAYPDIVYSFVNYARCHRSVHHHVNVCFSSLTENKGTLIPNSVPPRIRTTFRLQMCFTQKSVNIFTKGNLFTCNKVMCCCCQHLSCLTGLKAPPNGSLCVAGYRRLTGTVSKQCLFSFLFFSFRKQKKGGEAFDESMLELVSRMNAAFKTKAPQEIITVSSIPCQVPDDCPIFSFN